MGTVCLPKILVLRIDDFVSAQHAKGNERIPKCLRGLGYRSKFVRDLTDAPAVVELFSAIAGKPLTPHTMPMNMAHTNFGQRVEPGAKPVIVDQVSDLPCDVRT